MKNKQDVETMIEKTFVKMIVMCGDKTVVKQTIGHLNQIEAIDCVAHVISKIKNELN